jgi:hypothetical protein
MSIATLILGASGSGKSTSLRNLDPKQTLLIQCIKKPLPFRASAWAVRDAAHKDGNVFQTDDPAKIEALMRGTTKPIIVIDDYSQTMVNEMMATIEVKGYEKFTTLAKNAWLIFLAAGDLGPEKRVYVMSHTAVDESGEVRMKTIGKLVDEKILPPAYFTIVLRAQRINDQYVFSTQTTGSDPCKSPMGLFEEQHIPNDLAAVDAAISEYWGITTPSTATPGITPTPLKAA